MGLFKDYQIEVLEKVQQYINVPKYLLAGICEQYFNGLAYCDRVKYKTWENYFKEFPNAMKEINLTKDCIYSGIVECIQDKLNLAGIADVTGDSVYIWSGFVLSDTDECSLKFFELRLKFLSEDATAGQIARILRGLEILARHDKYKKTQSWVGIDCVLGDYDRLDNIGEVTAEDLLTYMSVRMDKTWWAGDYE